jgi:ribosomal RNA-processing protein 17
MRDERKQAVQDHVETVNKLLREARHAGTDDVQSQSGEEEGDEFDGFKDEPPVQPVDLEEEYIDEDRYTTVTIEAVNVDRDGLHKPEVEDEAESGEDGDKEGGDEAAKSGGGSSEKTKKEWPKKKKKKSFRYETKIERRLTEAKRKIKAAR